MDQPTVAEKLAMAKSIVQTFPHLANRDATHGYVSNVYILFHLTLTL